MRIIANRYALNANPMRLLQFYMAVYQQTQTKNTFTGVAVLTHPMIRPGIARHVVMILMIHVIIQLIVAFSSEILRYNLPFYTDAT